MSFCHNCGVPMPEDANFCPKCGKPVSSVEEPAKLEPPVEDNVEVAAETCMIVAELAGEKWSPLFPGDYIQFKARAGGPAGEFLAGESSRVKAGLGDYYEPNKKNKQHVKALDGLVEELKQAGWEQTGKGDAWYNIKFRRVKP